MNVVQLKTDPAGDSSVASSIEHGEPVAANEPMAMGEAVAAAIAAAQAAKAASGTPEKPLYVRTRAPEWLARPFAMLCGLVVFVAIWSIIAKDGRIPGPISTWHSAVDVFSDPFYSKGPNDQGIGWNILNSLGRVAIGFGMAAVVGIPMGFALGRFRFLSDMASPVI